MMMTTVKRAAACALLIGGTASAQPRSGIWLDRPLVNWNDPVQPLTRPAPTGETVAEVAARCDVPLRRETAGERALADAGWLPFHFVDRQIVQRDVELIGGMKEADDMCRPGGFNIFVFVGGRFAGTLSPVLMTSRADGVAGAVRLSAGEAVAAEFSRYTDADAMCCPSERVTVRFRIDRAPVPLVVPIGLQRTRP